MNFTIPFHSHLHGGEVVLFLATLTRKLFLKRLIFSCLKSTHSRAGKSNPYAYRLKTFLPAYILVHICPIGNCLYYNNQFC